MSASIRLLGRPSIDVDGLPNKPPRGRKSWAVLALVALSERPPDRRRVAGLLFADADDALGALRWCLTELRRALAGHGTIGGDPLRLGLRADATLDVRALACGDPSGFVHLESCGELLEGMSFEGCDAFESWLLVERRHQAGVVEALLREQTLACLALGRPSQAARLASRLVEVGPYAEEHHELLVRALAQAGERPAAQAAADSCRRLFRRELGVDPSPALLRAVRTASRSAAARVLGGRAAAEAQLEAGSAAIAAGAAEAGLDCLRRAVEDAGAIGDGPLQIRALVALGAALVHAVRGRDGEGASVLHEAVETARGCVSPSLATACRELGFVDVQAGRRDRAHIWLEAARQVASRLGDDAELAAIEGVEGMNLSDQAFYGPALDQLRVSVERALHTGSRRQAAWSASLIGRVHLLRQDTEESARALRQSLALVRAERWVAFQPWPETLDAQIDLAAGERSRAEERLSRAFALACQLGDPCWEGVSARGIALIQASEDPVAAGATLADALTRCLRWPDPYQWIHGYILDAACQVMFCTHDLRSDCPADALLDLSARTHMREFIVRAQLHRHHLGAPGAGTAATVAATDIDNPALHQLFQFSENSS